MVGKYIELQDAYKSVYESITHAGIANNCRVNVIRFDAEDLEKKGGLAKLKGLDGILVPGGFGDRGTEGKIAAARFARERLVPYFGICFGMQMAVIEAVRNLLGIAEANSTEFAPTKEPVVGLMTEWLKGNELQKRTAAGNLGGTMRLGAYSCQLVPGTAAAEAYGTRTVEERHRHRYEFNNDYREELAAHGMVFSGLSPDGSLVEIAEIGGHPWMLGSQFHPELRSRPNRPHPLFTGFVQAAAQVTREGDQFSLV